MVSLVGLGFIAVHLLYPHLAIDSTTVTLLIVVLVPWLIPYIRNIELPGGFKVELKEEIQSLKERLAQKGIVLPPLSPPRLSQLKKSSSSSQILEEWGKLYSQALTHIDRLDYSTLQELWRIDEAIRRYIQDRK